KTDEQTLELDFGAIEGSLCEERPNVQQFGVFIRRITRKRFSCEADRCFGPSLAQFQPAECNLGLCGSGLQTQHLPIGGTGGIGLPARRLHFAERKECGGRVGMSSRGICCTRECLIPLPVTELHRTTHQKGIQTSVVFLENSGQSVVGFLTTAVLVI